MNPIDRYAPSRRASITAVAVVSAFALALAGCGDGDIAPPATQ